MAANVTISPSPRITAFPNAAVIPVSIDANGATYAASTGGLPFDLFATLAAASPFSASINPLDIIGFVGISRAGWAPGQFLLGTTTSTTCPCTFKLWNGTTQFTDGACTQIVDGFLIVARNGAN